MIQQDSQRNFPTRLVTHLSRASTDSCSQNPLLWEFPPTFYYCDFTFSEEDKDQTLYPSKYQTNNQVAISYTELYFLGSKCYDLFENVSLYTSNC